MLALIARFLSPSYMKYPVTSHGSSLLKFTIHALRFKTPRLWHGFRVPNSSRSFATSDDPNCWSPRCRPNIAPNQGFATVIVGPTKQQFVIHQSLLKHYSKSFETMLDIRASDQAIDLAQEDAQIFEFFNHWLYYQRYPERGVDLDEIVDAWSKDKSDDAEDKGDTKSSNLIALHIFAHKHNIPQLQRDTLDEYFQHFQQEDTSLPPIDAIKHAFDKLDAHAPLCQLLIDIQCCCKQHENWTNETAQWYPAAFLLGTLRRYAAIVQNGKQKRWWKLDICDYHVHQSDEERVACKKEQKRRRRRGVGRHQG
ncbi:hypothetical protein ACN47E_003654 [Coniothyrium glycines]